MAKILVPELKVNPTNTNFYTGWQPMTSPQVGIYYVGITPERKIVFFGSQGTIGIAKEALTACGHIEFQYADRIMQFIIENGQVYLETRPSKLTK